MIVIGSNSNALACDPASTRQTRTTHRDVELPLNFLLRFDVLLHILEGRLLSAKTTVRNTKIGHVARDWPLELARRRPTGFFCAERRNFCAARKNELYDPARLCDRREIRALLINVDIFAYDPCTTLTTFEIDLLELIVLWADEIYARALRAHSPLVRE